ncbi:MAG: hypothetical protein KF734_09840 [Saprospiraceae bacterium]|nr:hypothetical protein [Saprospiraceae bacterium]
MQHTDWTYEDFRAFSMLFAANTDGYITADEEKIIAPTLPPDRYEVVKQRFLECSDAEALDVILECKEKYCATDADKDKVLADMRAIYEAHQGFEHIERGVHHIFERLFK